jgi:hypothetical protein
VWGQAAAVTVLRLEKAGIPIPYHSANSRNKTAYFEYLEGWDGTSPTEASARGGTEIQIRGHGFKVGGNYVAYYGEKIVNPSLNRDKLNESNAEDIYDGLKNLKGSALKVAQMLSMDKSIMPQQYVDKFSLSQFSVPPLSAPLVRKTFKKYLG